jgi:uncharacterized HhH-GPD family protein
MPTQLHFTASDEANALIATDPMALLVGFVLDQQVTVQKAFTGPLALQERLGSLDADTLAAADLEPIFRERPAIHRFPGAMAQRVHDLAVHVRAAAQELVPSHPTLGDVDSAQALADYQAAKRIHKKEWSKVRV